MAKKKQKDPIMMCRIDYETSDRTVWKANILAKDMQCALNLLMRKVPNFDRYTSTQILGMVDAIDDSVYEEWLVEKTEIVETVVTDDSDPKCPWCDKEFKSKQTLGTHIKKFHIDK